MRYLIEISYYYYEISYLIEVKINSLNIHYIDKAILFYFHTIPL